MFGLYIHIPYCRSKCRYCDFYSTPCPDGVPEAYIDALCREMDRFSPCGSTPLRPDTLYFGGGTPSLLTPAQAARLIRAAGPAPGAEITLEANPETVTPERLAAFRRAGVNRLSLGIQTARDDSLARLGRRHTAAQSRRALGMAVQAGFTDISGGLLLRHALFFAQKRDDPAEIRYHYRIPLTQLRTVNYSTAKTFCKYKNFRKNPTARPGPTGFAISSAQRRPCA